MKFEDMSRGKGSGTSRRCCQRHRSAEVARVSHPLWRERPAPAATRWGLLVLLVAVWLAGQAGWARQYPPSVPAPAPAVFPAPALRVLPNGLKVVVIQRHTLPLVTLRLVVKAGAEADPASLPGTAQLVSAVITEGTTTRSARQIAETIDSVGGTVDSGADWDSSYVTLTVLNEQKPLAFDLVADMVEHPAFAPDEIERARKQTLSGLEVMRDDPTYLADAAFRSVLFTGTAYSHPEDGTLEAVRHITREDLRLFHDRYYRPGNCILAIVGDIDTSEAFERAENSFGAWPDTPASNVPPGLAPSDRMRRVLVIDKPDAVQTEIRVGNLGVARDSPDFYALSVANQILGGPAVNRLFRALRSRQGLTYGASSDLLCYRNLGAWVAKTFTRTPETLKSVQITLEQVKSLRDHAISNSELETAKDYLVGHLALDFETSEEIASHVLELMIHNLPLDYWNRYPEKIRAVTREEVLDATRRYLDPNREVITLVGNVGGFKKDLKKLGPVQVIPIHDVDFGAQGLSRTPASAGKP
jgi:zinc protease